ncbi:MAG: spore germination protein GerW family protein [Oscillospiraceae bacterium]|nr:sporulation protein YtfJ [Oscillospiraceae bacterium]MBR0451881.1 sporulation protein YtfJ [Oscillospiraceae bacterium]MDO5139040.1 spore germination protein GerW family protein [Oscillospiraceae bacterium]
MSTERGLNLLTEVALNKIRGLTDSGTVIGEPITLPNGATAVPVSKISFGFASGGSDLPSKKQADMFGGGTGGGVTITPIAFLVTSGDSVKVMQLDTIGSTADNMVRSIPEILDKISELTGKKKSE